MMKGIIPRSEAKGTDFCGMGDWYYVIRSDLGCFMQIRDLNEGTDISIHTLHPACQYGDHYVGDCYSNFYIIKGNSYRRVKNLEKDSEAAVVSLHPNFQGGDHYLATNHYFYIIFQEKGTYRRTKNLNDDSEAVEYKLHHNCRNGLYYLGHGLIGHFSFIKPASEWGVEFYRGTGFSNDEPVGVYSVHPDVLNFLPGGLSVTKGTFFGMWENIKTITNNTSKPVTWQRKINKKVGYNKEKMTQISHNWKISASVTAGTGDIAKSIVKIQSSFSAEYGGSHVSTENESWNEATEVEEQLTFELKPNKSIYLWQYKLGLGQEPVLFCCDLMINDVPNPPTEFRVPPAQS